MAGKQVSSKFPGSKNQIRKALKNLLRLYSSHSSEIASVVVELLLKESGSSDFLCLEGDSAYENQSVFNDWKPAITKLSNREPKFLLALIETVHEMIETQESLKCGSGELSVSEDTAQEKTIDGLSDLFAWLVKILKGLKSARKKESPGMEATCLANTSLPKSILVELLRNALLLSCTGNNQLKCSTLVLANMVGNNSLVEKLNKLFLVSTTIPKIEEENSSITSSEIVFTQQKDSINQAAKEHALLKLRKKNSKETDKAVDKNEERPWVMVKKWNKCPIGMLPLGAASSALLPVLDPNTYDNHVSESSKNKEQGSLVERNLKRKPHCDVELFNEFSGKKMRENGKTKPKDDHGVQGKLMIGGVWKKVEQQELLKIAAGVKVLF